MIRNYVCRGLGRAFSPASRNFVRLLNLLNTGSAGKFAEWPWGRPSFVHLPPDERKQFNVSQLNFAKKADNIYTRNHEFKELVDNSLKWLFNTKLTAFGPVEKEAKKYAWLRVREYLYVQFRNGDLEKEAQNYTVSVSNFIRPSNPKVLVCQLLKCDAVSEENWQTILESQHVTSQQKLNHIMGCIYDHIFEQEMLPLVAPIRSSTNSAEDIDISNPAEWFPEARKLRRRIIMHIGSTNSGKTYRALQRLKQCDRGYYAGPLRLLAREVYDRFKSENIRCNLLTGEEVIEEIDEMGNPAGLTSGTVEMVPLSQKFDVVVLDEIQMMGDSDRGWAWTNALLGSIAREVHLCGEKSALPLVEKIVKMTGDELVVNEYERLGELKIEENCLKSGLKGLRKGDCVVAFSKKKILDLKLKIEKLTDLKVAVIYGSLPPETRIQQANMFNSGEYDVLVASDAVGMGLNLSIERVIFTTHMKFNGQEMVELSSSNVKQIGGRAGRFKVANVAANGVDEGKKAAVGYVTGVDPTVLTAVRTGMTSPIEYLQSAIVWPTDEICGKLMTHLPTGARVSTLLQTLATEVEKRSAKLFTLSDLKNRLTNISMFEHMDGIPFFDKMRLSNAPVKDFPMVKQAFVNFCSTIDQRQTRSLTSYPFSFNILNPQFISNDKYSLEHYESLHNIIMLYFWLGNRYPNYFIDQQSAHELKNVCEMIIFEKLDQLKRNPYVRSPAASKRSKPYLRR
ncbi:LAME_0H09142g1_1 [Lachancea meyersii CBS 8951]|uniref:ATP-dependent RNA helicase SUV3, mitochondrial n=1 Tax=Lachancea meyersii CBS 8951 TaxID=1266667 RepID=A0A1G4KFJ9_9SACH|nr:LAME_0H09142g1_1 [Lachancea meyersii CBS 8951]